LLNMASAAKVESFLPTREVASTLRAEGYAANEQGESLARRRYQRGTLILNEKRDEHDRVDKERSFWIGRWREDEIREGTVRRVRKWEELGTLASLPSRRLALRELEKRISSINDPGYRARPVATFAHFSERWESIVLVQHKPSTQATIRSHIKKYLVPFFGNLQLRDVRSENVQRFIASVEASPKTVRNIFITLRLMWKSARS
jgi:Phage integrase, N-terminal SAM-like domain